MKAKKARDIGPFIVLSKDVWKGENIENKHSKLRPDLGG